MKLSLKAVLPMLAVAFGTLGGLGMIVARPTLDTQPPTRRLPLVRVMTAESQALQLAVEAQGSVMPRTESTLVAEVSGRIIWTSPSLASGGFVEPGDVLVRIDPSDYEIAVERGEAALARAESQLDLARSNLERQRRLTRSSVSSPAALENAVAGERVAESNQREAKAALAQARRDLERTQVLAPFVGRVRQKHVDVGQYVGRGSPVARVYAVDYAEVRLPIPDRDVAFLDLPVDYRHESREESGPAVELRASFGSRDYSWQGRIVRTEGELDPKTRMIHAVARVEDPYGRGDNPDRPPLAVGLFVNARIQGRVVHDVVVLPRSALHGQSEVVLVDEANRLRPRRVELLRRDDETVVLRAGVEGGERVCTSPLSLVVDGMQVRTIDDAAAAAQVRTTHPRAREQETSPEPERATVDEPPDGEHDPTSAEAASAASRS